MIPVTRPFLPPIEEYKAILDGIWERQWLTNMGPLANELENKLAEHLAVDNLLFVTNGTVALQMAIKALDLKGEIITTPFSFVATTSSIVWEGCTPVFVDIDPKSLNIDATKIEEAITPQTSAILATHVYGNPCDVAAIAQIAQKHHLKVIYDGAHAFGVQINGQSIFQYGDISICSLHATKLYHSGEGGLMVTKDIALQEKLKYVRNFGISGYDSFAELGINGKNSEIHAAMGIVNIKYIYKIHEKRKELSELYAHLLNDQPISIPEWQEYATKNYAYFPVIFESESVLLMTIARLEKEGIQTRRYFYPSLASALPYVHTQHLPVTDDVSKKVLCLPLYYDLHPEEVQKIVSLLSRILDKNNLVF